MKKLVFPLSFLFIFLSNQTFAQQPLKFVTETGKNEHGKWTVKKSWNENGELIQYDSSFVSNQSTEEELLNSQQHWDFNMKKLDDDFETFFNRSFFKRDSTITKFDWEEFNKQFEFPEINKMMMEVEEWFKKHGKKPAIRKEESDKDF